MNRFKEKILLLLVLIIVISIPVNGHASNHQIDSLKIKLNQSSGEEKVTVLLSIAKETADSDLNASVKYTYEALAIAESLKNKQLISLSNKELGSFLLMKGNNNESLGFLLTALKLMDSENEPSDFINIYNNIGTIYSRKGELDSALFYNQAAYNLALKNKDSIGQISSLRFIGNTYYKKGEFDKALSHFRKGLSLAEYYKKAIDEKSHLLNNLGILYSDWGEYDKSLNYYQEALNIMDSLNYHSEMGRIFNNMGNIYWYKESYDSALIFYNKSLEKREKIGDENGKAYVLNNLGMIYGSMGDFDKSLDYFNQSLNLFEKISSRSGVVMATYNTASVYMEIKDWGNAKKYLNQGLIIAKEQGYKDYITANLEELTKVYENTDDWENAYQTLEKFKLITDSIKTQQNMDIIKELEIKYENEKYKADLSILKNQIEAEKTKKNQNLIILSGVIIIIILIILSTYLLISRMKIRTTNQYNKLTPALLRYQLNPEFINSSLSGIKELISKNRVKESGLFLSGFAKLMRIFIETSSHNAIVLDKELDTIQQFINLHKLRYEHDINFTLDIDPNIETEMIAIPPFIIFPVFVHLIDYHLNTGKIDIYLTMKLEKSKLLLETTIDYFSLKNELKSDTIDFKKNIKSIKDRIKSINKTYKEDIDFEHSLIQNKGEAKLNLKLFFPIKPI